MLTNRETIAVLLLFLQPLTSHALPSTSKPKFVLPRRPSASSHNTSPYLHFPHAPRIGSAYLPDYEILQFDIIEPLDDDVITNPAIPTQAWLRHPIDEHNHEDWVAGQGLWTKHRPEKRDVITVSDAPYPPGAYIDINNMTTIAIISQAVVARMQTWYEDGLYEWTAWWQTPVLGLAYVNLDIALGNYGNELLAKDLLLKNQAQDYMIDRYVDDQNWWAMFALKAYQAYGNQTWLNAAEAIVANSTLYWDNTCGGGVLWLTYKPLIKNTITNGLYFSILARLYRYTGNKMYFQYAMNTLNWWLTWAFETSTGRVYDTITAPTWYPNYASACNVTGLQTWTYNSGAFLYGLADLYYASGNETLLDLGRSIAYAAIRDFSDLETGVLQESCEHDGQPSPDLPPGCQQDEVVFKGILVMGMAELYLARPDPNIYNFINTQLLAATFNNIDSSWLYGEWWGGPWNETTAGPKTQVNALCLLAAAATINGDFLSKAGQSTTLTGYALDQVAVPNNQTLSGQAGSTQRDGSRGSRVEVQWITLGLLLSVGTWFVVVP